MKAMLLLRLTISQLPKDVIMVELLKKLMWNPGRGAK